MMVKANAPRLPLVALRGAERAMPAFFLTMLAATMASFGGRDYRLVAHLSSRLGGSSILLVIAWLSAAITAVLAGLAGMGLAVLLAPEAKSMLVAIALVLAAAELAWPWQWRQAEEPTRSSFAILLVLVAAQIGDGARFLILAITIATGAPWLAVLGGAVGSGIVLTVGWNVGTQPAAARLLRRIRLGLAAALALAGVVIGIFARGLV
jgi:hypothetical protein